MNTHETTLKKLGVTKGIIYEAIATTYNKHQIPNAAPMGFTYNGEDIVLRLFKNTQTYSNILETRLCTLNLCNDGTLFFYAALKEIDGENIILEKRGGWFHLKGAGACIDLEAREINKMDVERDLVICEIKKVTVYEQYMGRIAFTRADSALLESTIHATRIPVFLEKNDMENVKHLIDMIFHYRNVINRVAPKTRYEECMNKLLRYVDDLLGNKALQG